MDNALKTILTSARQSLEQTFPPAMAQLLRELVKPEPSFGAIAEIIKLDPAMSAAVLNLVNSPFYGLSQGITDLERAAVVLGTHEILKIALSVSYLNARPSQQQSDSTDTFCNWRMVVWSAIAAELMAEKVTPQFAQRTYLCTLLKDISLIALASEARAAMPTAHPHAPLTCLTPGQLDAERDAWSVTHPELSAHLLAMWDIPDIGCDSIRHHHDIDAVDSYPLETRIIILATRWAELTNDCHGMNAPEALVHHESLIRHTLSLSRADVEDLRKTCLTRFRSLLTTIGLSEVAPQHRLYEHSIQDMQHFHLQSMEIAGADGGSLTVARTIGRHLRWNFELNEWELSIHEPGQHRWSLYSCTKGQQITPSGAAESENDLPWTLPRENRNELVAIGDKWGELRWKNASVTTRHLPELTLYLRFVSRALESYSKRQAVLINKARTLDNLPVGVARLGADGRIWEINVQLFELLGHPKNPKGSRIADCLTTDSASPLGEDWSEFLASSERDAFSKIYCTSATSKTPSRCLYISAHKQGDDDILFMLEDVTEVSDIEVQALQHGAFLDQIVSSMRDTVLTVDAVGRIAFASPALEGELKGRNLFEVATPVHEPSSPWDASFLDAHKTQEVRLTLKNGKTLRMELVISPLVGSKTDHKAYLVVARDLTEVRRLEEKLRRQAVHDGLTGLFNHYQFHTLLEREVTRSQRTDAPLGLLFFDLDGFKQINDTKGHQAGDKVLRDVADILKKSIRKGTDFPCRYGGDEFAVIVSSTDREGLSALATRIHDAVQKHFRHSVSLSMGAALLEPQESPADLLQRADKFAYSAKAAGGDRIHWQAES